MVKKKRHLCKNKIFMNDSASLGTALLKNLNSFAHLNKLTRVATVLLWMCLDGEQPDKARFFEN